jgi:hypothetical protein
MIFHGMEMVIGEKHPWQSVRAGETYRPDSSWHVVVHDIVFINDPGILNPDRGERRQSMTRDRFDVKANTVRVSLLYRGEIVKSGDIRILAPLTHGNARVVLRRFEHGQDGLSARLRIVDAPLHTLFFTIYSLFIVNLAAWLMLRLIRP